MSEHILQRLSLQTLWIITGCFEMRSYQHWKTREDRTKWARGSRSVFTAVIMSLNFLSPTSETTFICRSPDYCNGWLSCTERRKVAFVHISTMVFGEPRTNVRCLRLLQKTGFKGSVYPNYKVLTLGSVRFQNKTLKDLNWRTTCQPNVLWFNETLTDRSILHHTSS